jgi:hypothetical protein
MSAQNPLTKIDSHYSAANGTTLTFALSSAHGYLTMWSVTYGGSAVKLAPTAPTPNPTFSITVAPPPGGAGNTQSLHVMYDALSGGPGQEDIATLSLVTPAGSSVVWSQSAPQDGLDFNLFIAAI